MNNDRQAIFERLRTSRYFRNIAEESLLKLIMLAEVRSFAPGETIMDQGEFNNPLFVLTDGEVSVHADDELVYRLKRRGDIFGEVDAVKGEPSSVSVRALSAVEVITISAASLEYIRNDRSHELHHVFQLWLARVLSEKLALTTQKAKRHEKLHNQLRHELETAKFVQQAVFGSSLTPIPGTPLFLRSEFADILGGDVYGVFQVAAELYGILIGDVSGHGTPAALIAMGMLNSFLQFSKNDPSSRRVLENVNGIAQQSMPQDRFMTAFYGLYHPVSRHLTYTDAGHHPALVLRSGRVQRLPAPFGIPIGIQQSELAGYTEGSFQLLSQDRLILFTDGVLECRKGERLSLGDFERFIEENAGLPPQEFRDAVFGYGRGPSPGSCKDDLTVMIFEVQ